MDMKRTKSWADEVDDELGDPSNQTYWTPPDTTETPANTSKSEEAEGSRSEEGEAKVPEGFETRSHFSDSSSDDGSAEEDDADTDATKSEENNQQIAQQNDQSEEPLYDEAGLKKWCIDNAPGLLDNGALTYAHGSQDEEVIRHDNDFLYGRSPPERERKTKAKPVFIIPSPTAITPAQLQFVERQRDAARAAEQTAYSNFKAFVARNEGDMRWTREEMFRAFQERDEERKKLAAAEQERDTWKIQFGKAKPFVVAERERKRKLEEDSRDSGTQTDVLQFAVGDLTMYEARMKLVSRIMRWLDGVGRRSVGPENNILPSADRLSDVLSDPKITVPGLVAALREEGLVFDTADLESVIQNYLNDRATGQPDTADAPKCPKCPRLLEDIKRFKAESEQHKATSEEMKSRNRYLTEIYEEVVEVNVALNAKPEEQDKKPADSRPDGSPQKLEASIALNRALMRDIYGLRDDIHVCDRAIDFLRKENTSIRKQAQWHEDKYQEGYRKSQILMKSTSSTPAAPLESTMPIQPTASESARPHTSVTTQAQRDARWAAAVKHWEANKSKGKARRVEFKVVVKAVSKVALQAIGRLASLLRWFVFWFIVLFFIFAVMPGPLNRLWLSYESLS